MNRIYCIKPYLMFNRSFNTKNGCDVIVLNTVKEFRKYRESIRDQKLTHGFVPTMGALHDGHISLIREAKKHCNTTSCSIFVNPAQFGANEDLDKYPRVVDSDLKKLREVGVDALFLPPVSELYPSGITQDVATQVGTFVEVKGLSHQLEGSARPTHFRGVATVVSKLFNAVQPDMVFFGQKDVQQCVVLKSMVKDLLYPLKMVVCPTVREADGLAMSSRNIYLNAEQRKAAPVLYRALCLANAKFSAGKRKRAEILDEAILLIKSEPVVKFEYFTLSHPRTLAELEEVGKDGAILSGVIRVGTTRLLDNILLGYKL